MKRRSFITALAALFVPKIVTVTAPSTPKRASLKELMVHKKNKALLAGRGEHNPLFAGEYGGWQGHATYKVNLAEIDSETWDKINSAIEHGNLQFGV